VASIASVEDDYVASNELISMALAMISEQRQVNMILKELFSAYGNVIQLFPVDTYILPGAAASFWELGYIGKLKDHQVIGLRSPTDGVVLDPENKMERTVYPPGTDVIVLATLNRRVSIMKSHAGGAPHTARTENRPRYVNDSVLGLWQ
jgi:hypothetical protein